MESNLNKTIPTVDLSPFFHEGDESGRKKAIEIIGQACQTYGFFRIVNHGVPVELMAKAIELSKSFFGQPDEEKLRSGPDPGSSAAIKAGYARQPECSPDKNEYFMVFSPELGFNVYPTNPPEFRSILEECFAQLSRTSALVEGMLNECMGLPPGFLKEYNKDRSSDFMVALRYFPATDTENNGLIEHEDGGCISFVFQDDVGGLEVLKDGEWIPAEPREGSIVVNVGDVIQVLTNKKFKSATHRVVRKATHRHSFVFFANTHGENWIEPLSQFTGEISAAPEYKGFLYKDYLRLRMRNKTHPPSKPEDIINISHYAITS